MLLTIADDSASHNTVIRFIFGKRTVASHLRTVKPPMAAGPSRMGRKLMLGVSWDGYGTTPRKITALRDRCQWHPVALLSMTLALRPAWNLQIGLQNYPSWIILSLDLDALTMLGGAETFQRAIAAIRRRLWLQ